VVSVFYSLYIFITVYPHLLASEYGHRMNKHDLMLTLKE